MEPRPIERGNLGLFSDRAGQCRLQWSHAQSSVETVSDRGEARNLGAASMEPRPIERGNCAEVIARAINESELQWSHAQSSVETAVSQWARAFASELQWSHAQSSVETGPRPAIKLGFDALQWSHAQSSVETPFRPSGEVVSNMASMEPRPIERGNTARMVQHGMPPSCFNGATPNRAWKPHDDNLSGSRHIRFNGATPNRAWKPACAQVRPAAEHQLQWSHAQSSVETTMRPNASPP